MGDKIDKKVTSLFSRRDNLESELRNAYSLITDLVQRKKRRSTIEQAISKAESILEGAFNINTELKNLAKHTASPGASDDDLAQWTDVTLKNHHQIINDARAFIETFKPDDESSVASMKFAASANIEKTLSSKSSKAASMTCRQRKRAH